jgi:hypothetical protein
MVLGAHVAPGPAVVLVFCLREGDRISAAVQQLDPGLQHLYLLGGGLVDHPE